MKKHEGIPVLAFDRRCTTLMKAVSWPFRSVPCGFSGALLFFALLACQVYGQGTNLAFLTNGLVAYYPFNGNANDMSGNGDDGTLFGATLMTDRFARANSAFSFDYTSLNAIQTTGSHVQRGLAFRTFCLWFKQSPRISGDYLHAPLLSLWDGTSTQRFEIQFWGNSLYVYQQGMAGYKAFDGPSQPMVDGKWHQLLCVVNTNTVSAYIDSKAVVWNGELPIPGTQWNLPQGSLWIGYGHIYYDGSLDDVRIYDRALQLNEIQALFQYESQPRQRLSIAKAVRLDLTVEVGKRYQLETSSDLNTWTPYSAPFTATTEAFSQYVDVADYNQFFRLIDAP